MSRPTRNADFRKFFALFGCVKCRSKYVNYYYTMWTKKRPGIDFAKKYKQLQFQQAIKHTMEKFSSGTKWKNGAIIYSFARQKSTSENLVFRHVSDKGSIKHIKERNTLARSNKIRRNFSIFSDSLSCIPWLTCTKRVNHPFFGWLRTLSDLFFEPNFRVTGANKSCLLLGNISPPVYRVFRFSQSFNYEFASFEANTSYFDH